MHVLILQLKRIGDAILTTPLLSALREHVPGCAITLALDAGTSALAPAIKTDHVLVFRRGIAGLNFWSGIAKGGFDICLDVTGNDRSAVATALCRAPKRVTWARVKEKTLRRVVYTDFVESSVRQRHTSDHHTDLLRTLGIHVENVPLELRLPSIAQDEAARALSTAGISGNYAVVHAGTARAEKYWQPERWASVIGMLRGASGLPVVLTGSADSKEQVHLDEIQRKLSTPCPNLSGKLSLLGTAAVIGQAHLLCAVDSAPVHLADALGTPLVALFGPTNPFHWRPRRASSRIVTASPGMEITPDFPKSAMSEISVDDVTAAIGEQLALINATNPSSPGV
ncbi:MAG: glycosyltransferase family 9 protein [Chthoniobacterales bacterium]